MRVLTDILLIITTWIYPFKKNQALFVFKNNSRSSGNAMALFNYINDEYENDEKRLTSVIATDDDSFINYLKSNNKSFCRIPSLKFIKVVATSKYLICDGSPLIIKYGIFSKIVNMKIVYLWHGTGFKNIKLLANDTKENSASFNHKLLNKSASMILSSSIDDQIRKIKSFNNNNVFITGNPKNDTLLRTKYEPIDEYISYNKILLYVPTYRDNGNWEPFTEDYLNKLNKMLLSKNMLFIIKKHVNDTCEYLKEEYSNIKDITEMKIDNNRLLVLSDVMISDYSSIVTDYVLLDKPVIFYIPDYKNYTQISRSLYYDIFDIYPRSIAYTDEQLYALLEDTSWFNDHDYRNKYNDFKSLFHQYTDANSCKRVVEVMTQL